VARVARVLGLAAVLLVLLATGTWSEGSPTAVDPASTPPAAATVQTGQAADPVVQMPLLAANQVERADAPLRQQTPSQGPAAFLVILLVIGMLFSLGFKLSRELYRA